MEAVLCRVIDCDDRLAAIICCTSNLLTRELSVLEEAYMISRLISDENFTMTEIGKLFSRSKSWVSRRLTLLTQLDRKMKKEMEQGFLHPRVAQELARLPQGNDQARVLKLIRSEHMGKDATAELVSWWLKAGETERKMVEQKGFLKDTEKICGADFLPTFGTPGGTFKCFDKQCVKIAGDCANVGSPKGKSDLILGKRIGIFFTCA